CPEEFGLKELEGCPKPDSDGDGILDEVDDCPEVAGLAEFKGCPDSDGDLVPDREDDCPNEKGILDLGGCPDRDGDGVKDDADKCPDLAGTAELSGCPEIEEEVKEQLEFATKSVQFESASNVLKTSSYAVLDTIVSIMNEYTGYHLRASGHTDSRGEVGPNQLLSEKRAKACIDYLISKGIDPERVESVGFGESKPIADNINRAGRAKNRRVEFELFVP
ncbi:MAG: OmpA family protein, partial [Bacteroidota bacterium]